VCRKFFDIVQQTAKGKRVTARAAMDVISQLYAVEPEA
jgi:hypothetical protein